MKQPFKNIAVLPNSLIYYYYYFTWTINRPRVHDKPN